MRLSSGINNGVSIARVVLVSVTKTTNSAPSSRHDVALELVGERSQPRNSIRLVTSLRQDNYEALRICLVQYPQKRYGQRTGCTQATS
jgi:hypothetical protein